METRAVHICVINVSSFCRILELKDTLGDINLGFNKLSTIPLEFSKLQQLAHIDLR